MAVELADVPTPIGTFRIAYEGRSVRWVDLLERGISATPIPDSSQVRRPPFAAGSPPRQLSEYFHGRRNAFDVDVDLDTTSVFDRDVYRVLVNVPVGRTISYGELARRSGHGGAARAVGGAMHRNPIPIVIPCHRVVGRDRKLTGFGLGLWRKRWLLDREGAWPLASRSIEGPRDPSQRTFDEVKADGRVVRSLGPRRRKQMRAAQPA
ncbi:MAG: methylated-DNA--[protein]-cysteine S-methyltransferase [Thermoplasmata archaeon]